MRHPPLAVLLLTSVLVATTAPAPDAHAAEPKALPAPTEDSPETWKTTCDKGDAAACLRLGAALEAGTDGLTADAKGAAKRYDQACKKKLAAGCVRLGDLHARKLVPGGVGKAKKAYVRACDLNDGPACYLVSQTEVPGKPKHVAVTKKACELKVADACFALAVAYKGGFVKGADPAEAKVWFQKACDLGHRAGCGHAR